ncbi:MAG: 2-isopropylmalate synthase [Clostridium sp.]|jgi:2-isopropylmalate synthase|nr:2-isopropylmalate synthase [Clostridium sp.]
MPRQVKIFDTTLRDGEQSPGCSMNLQEKLELARQLEALGVDVIEAGFAVSSPGDFESVKSVADLVKDASVCSLARAVEKDIDAAYDALRTAAQPRIHLFIATSPIHMKYKLRMSPQQVLERTAAMVAYAKKYCADVEFSAEDATRSEREFLAQVVRTAIASGATTVNIPDTVGYTTPAEMRALIEYLRESVDNIENAVISLHCHDDLGMAAANSLAGVRGGAGQIECTVNGIGERAGNAPLEEVVMALRTRGDYYGCQTRIDSTKIYRTSRLVYNIIGQSAPLNKAIVGKNAFSHESGIHQHGVLAEKSTYEIITPESVGFHANTMVLGKHSGRHAFSERLKELGYKLSAEEIDAFFVKFKEICDRKKNISDADLEAIVDNRQYVENYYELESFSVQCGKGTAAVCVVKLRRGEERLEDVSMGDGPVDAAYNAVDKLVGSSDSELESYSIHSSSDGKDALGEVVVKLRRGEQIVTGRGLSTDIIESSILAYVNAINKLGISPREKEAAL